MAAFEDFLASGQVPLGEEGEKFRNLLRTVNTYNVNRSAGRALALAGADVNERELQGEVKPGVLSTVLRGLSVPRNLLFRAVGTDPNITGGDVFRTRKDDSLLERVGKFAGAFAFDVITDPLTYVGAPSVLGRKSATTLIASKTAREAALEAAEGALRGAGRDSDALVETLFRNSRLKKLADQEVRTIGAVTDEARTASQQLRARREDIMKAANVTDTEADTILRKELAGEEFGRVIGESLLVGGRKSVLDNITRLVGDEQLARSVFQALPSEVRGGIVFRSLTGKPIGRVPGTGRGDLLGRPGELLNVMRFKASETVGRAVAGATGQAGLSGQFGPAWQAVRSGLRKSLTDPKFDILRDNLGRETLTTYTAFKNAHRNMSRARLTGSLAVWNLVGEANALERDFADKGFREDYLRGRLLGLHAPETGAVQAVNDAERSGMEIGRKFHAAMAADRLRMAELGIPVNDLGPGYVPLYLTEEGAKRRQLSQKVTTGTTGEFAYSPMVHRKEWIREIVDPEEAKLLGYRIAGTNTVALSPVQINKLLGRNDFITDPIQIATRYLEHSSRAIASQRFVNEALRAGVLVADANYAAKQAQFDRLANFMSGVRRAAPKVAKRIDSARAKADEALAAAVGESTRDKTVQEATALRIKLNAEYDAAVAGQRAAADALRQADDLVESTRPTSAEMRGRLTGYARTNLEQELDEAARLSENARRRMANRERRYNEALGDLRDVRQTQYREGSVADEIIDDAYTAAELRYDELVTSQEAKETAAKELAAVRSARNNLRGSITLAEETDLAAYEAALVRREQLVRDYEVARKVRLDTAKRWSKFKAEPAVKSAAELDTLARRLARAQTAYKKALADSEPDDVVKTAREAVAVAEKALRGAIGYKLPKGSPLAVYRDTVERLAKDLGEAELDAAKVLSSESKLVDVLDQLQEAYDANDMGRITQLADSLKETWFTIREKGVTFADLTTLNKAERAILSAKVPRDLELIRMVPKMSEFGEWLTENEMAIIAARGLDTGTSDPVRMGRLQGLHASTGVRTVLENMYRAETTTAFKRFADKVLDPLLLMWKTGVTVGRGPAYILSNLIGGVYMSFLGNVEAGSLAQGGKILVQMKSAYEQATKELPAASDPQRLFRAAEILEKELADVSIGKQKAFQVLRDFLELGGYGSTQTMDALELQRRFGAAAGERAIRFGQTVRRAGEEATTPWGKGYQGFVDAMLTNGYQRRMNNWAQSSELFLRFGTYLDGIKKFDDSVAALDRVNLLHFDYADLSDAEQSIRRLVPFYTWTRHNVPLQLRAMVLDPGKMKKWMYAQDNIRKALEDDEESWYEQLLPEYLQDVGGFVSRLSTPAGPIAFGSRMPYDDVNRLFKVGGMPLNWREAAKAVGPSLTLPASLVGGVNLDTGAKFGPEGVEAGGWQALLAGTPGVGGLLGARRGAAGETRIGGAQAYAISELFPQLSVLDRLLSTTPVTRPLASKQQQERALSNFLNLTGIAAAAGLSATTLAPTTMTGEARRRITKQNAVINDAAGRLGISVDWLREQIRAGLSDEQIADAIRRGEGQLAAYEAEKEAGRKPLDRRYADMLEAMARGELNLGY